MKDLFSSPFPVLGAPLKPRRFPEHIQDLDGLEVVGSPHAPQDRGDVEVPEVLLLGAAVV